MKTRMAERLRKLSAPPHPTWQSKESRNRVIRFLAEEEVRSPGGLKINVGSGSRRFDTKTLNLDFFAGEEVDVQGDLLFLPIKDKTIRNVVLASLLGLFLMVFLVFFLEYISKYKSRLNQRKIL